MNTDNTGADRPQRQDIQPSHLGFPVVGIGASAGGLQAVQHFFEHMPTDSGMAFVVVLHLSPDHQSNAGKLIANRTKIPVTQLTTAVPIERNHVYVISPAQRLSMNDGYLRGLPSEPRNGRHVTIDLFFRDLADAHKEHAFCVVLSGTGSDGAVGLSRIKEQGGVTLAQHPEDAEFDGMPQAAINTHKVDFVLPVVEMPQKILDLWHNAQRIQLPNAADIQPGTPPKLDERAIELAEQALIDILTKLRAATGHDFKHYKRATVLRRIERRMQVATQPDLPAYYRYICEHADETKALLDDMLIGVTNFFRDRESFESLEREVIPQLFARQNDTDSNREIRVWSAGASTGEEAYSLAILLNDYKAETSSDFKIQVFASDIDERAVSTGRTGLYSEAIITDVSPVRLRQYFVKEDANYRVRKDIRERVLFAKHSLLADPPFSQIDMIVCRNLLIYLDRDIQREILHMFHFALRAGGYLFLGTSESPDACPELFTTVDKKNRIFRARGGPNTHRLPAMPRGGYARTISSSLPSVPRPVKKPSTVELYQRAAERFSPPSIIVNSEADVLYISQGAGRYLQHMTGEVSDNLLSLVNGDLRLELRTTIYQAQQAGQSSRARPINHKRDGQHYQVQIEVHPFTDSETELNCLYISFTEQEVHAQDISSNASVQSENQIISNLDRELQRTKLQLQDVIEQSEVSSEELKASNEEMQAINEELRSASEELETSKEELQSINEELLTVNHELKIKVEETDQVNDYLSNLISSTDIATVFVDRELRIKWFTPRATSIFSMLAVDAGRPLMDITHRLEYDGMAEDAMSVFETLKGIEREIASSDGRWYIVRILPYRSNADQIGGIVLTFIDITSRREAEQELRLSEERMRLVTESTHDYAIIVLNEEGFITDWNDGARNTFGFSRDEAEGRHFRFIFSAEDQRASVPEMELETALAKGRSDDERWHARKDGSQFYCSGEVTALASKGFQGFVKIARDLTDHIKLHEEQQQSLKASLSSSQQKDQFFAVMSHELKHPLNLIQLNAQVARRLPVAKKDPTLQKAITTITDAVASQARIIDDLMDVARIRNGKLQLQCQPLDLVVVLNEIQQVVLKAEPGCKIQFKTPEQSLFIHADQTRIEQIIWNLISNAIKFTPTEGTVQIVTTKLEQAVRIEVIDTGPGIEKDQLERIFEMFGQADHRPSGQHRGGLGIGLALVEQLVESHHGKIQANSEGAGKGSRFTVELPLTDAPDQHASHDPDNDQGQLAGIRILLVDDSPEVLEALQLLLELEDAHVLALDHPSKALSVAQAHRFDVIISDIGLPSMNGHELLAALRKLPNYALLPAIALTGYGAAEGMRHQGVGRFDASLGKPVAMEDLTSLICQLVTAAGQRF
ncbi:methylesterase, CheB family/methyltransferase, CheR family/sensor histidine kinase/response regulator [Pseudomonas fluorescens]|uniref:histidine kinase n=2 Tax=Pseudomonas fluorescens TaxID=294 RepID=A0A448DVI7_PSEFL|nr:CheR family methyltransferase [Pseudomonas fluorescens]VEF10834.1 methylesterase, CheB family/methyltransferase, CheR family/sensor histidine kinase/response regulator [Pseudomonas fluorescens]